MKTFSKTRIVITLNFSKEINIDSEQNNWRVRFHKVLSAFWKLSKINRKPITALTRFQNMLNEDFEWTKPAICILSIYGKLHNTFLQVQFHNLRVLQDLERVIRHYWSMWKVSKLCKSSISSLVKLMNSFGNCQAWTNW